MVTLEQKLQVTNSSHPGSKKKKKAFFFKFSIADMCVCVYTKKQLNLVF